MLLPSPSFIPSSLLLIHYCLISLTFFFSAFVLVLTSLLVGGPGWAWVGDDTRHIQHIQREQRASGPAAPIHNVFFFLTISSLTSLFLFFSSSITVYHLTPYLVIFPTIHRNHAFQAFFLEYTLSFFVLARYVHDWIFSFYVFVLWC